MSIFNFCPGFPNSGFTIPSAIDLFNLNPKSPPVALPITVPFSYINDSLVSVSENEINIYYKDNIEDYKQEESKDVDYVVFNVVYSAEDELET